MKLNQCIVTTCDDSLVDQLNAFSNSIRANYSPDIEIVVIPRRRMRKRVPVTVRVMDDYVWLLEWEDFMMKLCELVGGTSAMHISERELRCMRMLCAFDGPYKEFIYLPVSGLVMNSLDPLFTAAKDGEVGSVPYLGGAAKQNKVLGRAFVSKNVIFDKQARLKVLSYAMSLSRSEPKSQVEMYALVNLMFEACSVKSRWLDKDFAFSFAPSGGLKTDRLSVFHNGVRLTYLEFEEAQHNRLKLHGRGKSSLREIVNHYYSPDDTSSGIDTANTRTEEPISVRCARASKFVAEMALSRVAHSTRKRSTPVIVTSESERRWIKRGDRRHYANAKEIRIIGLRRTGNHALIHWIQQQAGGGVFLNDLRVDCNPFLREYLSFCAKSDIVSFADRRELFEAHDFWLFHSLGFFSQKELLIVNYEDYWLDQVFHEKWKKKHDEYFGNSKIAYDVLILRDPYNLAASRIKGDKIYVRDSVFARDFVEMWKSYAREFIGETHFLKENKVVVNYNLWATCANYRETIAAKLNVPFTDAGINDVPTYGRGSSFDGLRLNGFASSMNVLERWKEYGRNEFYNALLTDAELGALSEQIFGKILC